MRVLQRRVLRRMRPRGMRGSAMSTKYYLIAGTGRTIVPIHRDDVLAVPPNPAANYSRQEILDSPDNPRWSIIPLIEQVEWEEEEDLPPADVCEMFGFDSTARSGTVTWKDIVLQIMDENR
jgi:hypothetical protein